MKNKTYFIIGIFCLAATFGCSPKTNLIHNYVKPVTTSVSASGIIYLTSNGYGKKKEEAIEEAKRNALKAVLFDGVPGSKLKRPLVNQPGARNANRSYFDSFFAEGGRYTQFVTLQKTDPINSVKVGAGRQEAVFVEVNYLSLQRELEAAGVIEKFGI
jgi:hypothetical protein